jgi:hypothetical protein
MTEAHAEYAPSSMYLTVACPGWRKQASKMPPEAETEESREGDAGHWVALFARTSPAELSSLVDVPAPNGVTIDDDMVDGASIWVDALEHYPARLEQPVQVSVVHATKCWGTPDAWQWAAETNTLRVADYKYGHGYVDEFENWQLMTYAAGIIVSHVLPENINVQMTIVQPRFYNGDPVRSWTIGAAELWPYVERMKAAVAEAESDNPRVISGNHCTHCPARATCKTFQKTVANAVEFTGTADPMVSLPEDVGNELALVQRFMKRLKARETGLAAMAESMLKSGKRVPGFKLEQSVGRLAWTATLEEVEFIAKLKGQSALKPPALITPTQAKDRKIIDVRVMPEYAERPLGAMKLIPAPTTAKRIFQK